MSRQYEYQKRNRASGKCVNCPKNRVNKTHCEECAKKNAERSKRYRLKHTQTQPAQQAQQEQPNHEQSIQNASKGAA